MIWTSLCAACSSDHHCLVCGFCSSGREFGPRFLQTVLAVQPLRFTRASPPSGCTGDSQTAGHARGTQPCAEGAGLRRSRSLYNCRCRPLARHPHNSIGAPAPINYIANLHQLDGRDPELLGRAQWKIWRARAAGRKTWPYCLCAGAAWTTPAGAAVWRLASAARTGSSLTKVAAASWRGMQRVGSCC
jgi:hypothetical protein